MIFRERKSLIENNYICHRRDRTKNNMRVYLSFDEIRRIDEKDYQEIPSY